MHNVWLFLMNVVAHLVASMSGIVSFVIAFYEAVRNRKIESWIFFAVGAICLIIAFDQAWQDEHRNVETLIAEKSTLWQERDFWRNQSYEKDASLRIRDSLLEKDTVALGNSQGALANLSNKILELDKPQAQKFTVRRVGGLDDFVRKWKHYEEFVVMTNVPVEARYLVACNQPMGDVDARIAEGGPRFPMSVQEATPNEWMIHIPSPQITPGNPLLITVGYNEDSLGICQTGPS